MQLLPAQEMAPVFTEQDTLRGAVTAERAWWDLTYYHLDIRVNPATKTISGQNTIRYTVLSPGQRLQIDLQPPMQIQRVTYEGVEVPVEDNGNAHYVRLPKEQMVGRTHEIVVEYDGEPKVSSRPPWDGGFTWKTDANGLPLVATSCQGDGASLWWPCKDHMYDEVDSMLISVRVPGNLMDVSNGRLRRVDTHSDGTKTYHWAVTNPINNYGVNVNVGDYVHFGETYDGEGGTLDCDYYVLRDNLAVAQEQFKQVKPMLAAFEHWFGPYPFYADGYKLVEVPYLGMEHQSSVTYGNHYKNGYLGRDLSTTGWGLKFDFIIIHESGHEWFANSITHRDAADMWLHESFTAYAENLYLNELYGPAAADAYVRGTRSNVMNDRPVQSPYRGVNYEGSSDMYYKGANMLHMLRAMIDDDEQWRTMLRGLNKTYYHQTVDSKQVEEYLDGQTKLALAPFFEQYLRHTRIPMLEYRFYDATLLYRWANCVDDFAVPVKVYIDNKAVWLHPKTGWQSYTEPFTKRALRIDPAFYVGAMDITVE